MNTDADFLPAFDSTSGSAGDLAQGFAEHAQAWATTLGAPPAARRALGRAAQRLALAGAAGHVCLPLDELADDENPAALGALLLGSGVVAGADEAVRPGEARPLVLDDGGRLYLRRHFDLERGLAAAVHARALSGETAAQDSLAALTTLCALLDRFFPPHADGRADWQRTAAALALLRRLTVISGGPGTGKTTTVAALLGCLLEQYPAIRVALAAPTGKAAARMLEALRARAASLPANLRARLPDEAATVHRLLGVTPHSGRFVHHAGNPLPFDVVVVDEASMLDLALAARLVDAVPAHARLILLGDKDQLAAVEAGAVFAELSAGCRFSEACAAHLETLTGHRPAGGNEKAAVLPDTVIWLRDSHRFAAGSGIGRLAAGINAGEGAATLDWLRSNGDAAVCWLEDSSRAPGSATRARCEAGYTAYLETLRTSAGDPAAVFAAFERFRVLAAVHQGPRGVRALNAHLGQWLRAALSHPDDRGENSPWYPGRPVIILRNDYALGLFNGDVGLTLTGADGIPSVWFPAAGGGYRAVPPARLPAHDTAFALTVHKSQGSEFAEVLVILPDAGSPVLTRELLYTGVTRAARGVALSGSPEAFLATCARRAARHSGLAARLSEAGGGM